MAEPQWTWADAVMALHEAARREERNAMVLRRDAEAYRRRGAVAHATRVRAAADSAAASGVDLRSQADALHALMRFRLEEPAGERPSPGELEQLVGAPVKES